MEIISFKISNDKSNLILSLTNASGAEEINLWTDKTYKYLNKKIDLSDQLNGSATQNISIPLSVLGFKHFDGVYFIEVISGDKVCSSITGELTKYEECLTDKILEHTACVSCQKVDNPELTIIQALLDGLNLCIDHGFPQEIMEHIKALDKYCGGECRSCGSYKNPTSSNYFTFNIVSK